MPPFIIVYSALLIRSLLSFSSRNWQFESQWMDGKHCLTLLDISTELPSLLFLLCCPGLAWHIAHRPECLAVRFQSFELEMIEKGDLRLNEASQSLSPCLYFLKSSACQSLQFSPASYRYSRYAGLQYFRHSWRCEQKSLKTLKQDRSVLSEFNYSFTNICVIFYRQIFSCEKQMYKYLARYLLDLAK